MKSIFILAALLGLCIGCGCIHKATETLSEQMRKLTEFDSSYINSCIDNPCALTFYSLNVLERDKCYQKLMNKYRYEFNNLRLSQKIYDSAKAEYTRINRKDSLHLIAMKDADAGIEARQATKKLLIQQAETLRGSKTPTMRYMDELLSINLRVIETDSELRKAQIGKFILIQHQVADEVSKRISRERLFQKRDIFLRDLQTMKLKLGMIIE